MHFLGHFVGISGRPTPVGTVTLTLPAPVARVGPIPLLSYCAFADLTLMSAIRSHVGRGARLGTVTLSIQHPRTRARGPILGVSRAPAPYGAYGVTQAVFTIGGEVIGHAQASASALPAPAGRTLQLLPWELDCLPSVPTLTPAELDANELQILTAVQAASRRARAAGTAVEDELLHFAWQPSDADQSTGELTIGPELGNRVGQLQGGALYAAGARAAEHALGNGDWVLGEGAYQFLRPGDGRRLTARAGVLRRGRSVAFAQAHLSVDDVPIGAGLYTFRPAD
jgi:acyl-coenzyme A thioesterase PaaI-like protein